MDKIISELKSTADKVAKKSGELVEISKIKLNMVTTKSEIGTNFKVLGELVYLAQRNANEENTEKIEETIKKIDELYEKLSELTELSSALKNEKICVFCGKSNPIDQPFCGGCGQKIARDEESGADDFEEVVDVETI